MMKLIKQKKNFFRKTKITKGENPFEPWFCEQWYQFLWIRWGYNFCYCYPPPKHFYCRHVPSINSEIPNLLKFKKERSK